MQKIIPNLWFDHQAERAAEFYCSIFPDSEILKKSFYGESGAAVSGMPEGTVLTVGFRVGGLEFVALNGGPVFSFTPAISFFVNCTTEQEQDQYWEKLSEGGTVLMEMGPYPFSRRFGWVMDQFGVSWQLSLEHEEQKLVPFLMFTGEQHGNAEKAMEQYVSLFERSGVKKVDRYTEGEGQPEGTVQHASFILDGVEFMAIDSSFEHGFTFTEAISFQINCETQEEIDLFWERLSEGGEQVECGWLKDRYGVSWQVVPTILDELLANPDPVRGERMMKAMLQMKKLDIAQLEKAYYNA